MTIQEILEEHTQSIRNGRCYCEDRGPKRTEAEHNAHLAEVLDKYMQELQANSKPNQNLEFNPRELNRRGWTCGCEPGNYDTCEECQSACNELANFLNRPEVNDA